MSKNVSRAWGEARPPPDGPTPVARLRRTMVYLHSVGTSYGSCMSDAVSQQSNAWAALLRDITTRPDWSVARLAREANLHRSTIFRWLNGEISNLTIDSIRLIVDAAGIDMWDALRAVATLVAPSQTPPTRRFVDPASGEEFVDPIEQDLWSLEGLSAETRRGLIAYLRADRGLRRRRAS